VVAHLSRGELAEMDKIHGQDLQDIELDVTVDGEKRNGGDSLPQEGTADELYPDLKT
jgi:hypothetical protein